MPRCAHCAAPLDTTGRRCDLRYCSLAHRQAAYHARIRTERATAAVILAAVRAGDLAALARAAETLPVAA